MALTKWQIANLETALARLDVRDPAFRGSEQVKQALGESARSYIETWVLPLLEELRDGVPNGMRYYRNDDYARVCRDRRNAERKAQGLPERDGAASDTVAQGERASLPGYDPTCAMCESGEEPGHEH